MNPALEADLRGETCLAILAYLAWSEAHGGTKLLLDGSVAKWLTSGRPEDPGIARSLVKLRSMLARYVDHGGRVPEWVPPKLLEAIGEPWCAADLAPSSATRTDALPDSSPSENPQKQAADGGHSEPNNHEPKERP